MNRDKDFTKERDTHTERPTLPITPVCKWSNLYDTQSKPHCWDLNPQPLLLKGTTVFQPSGYSPSFIYPSIWHSSISTVSLLSTSCLFFPFSAPLCLFWSIYLPPPLYHDLFLSTLLWHFHLRLMSTFPSLIYSLHLLLLHSLCHGSFICSPLTLTDLSFTTSLSVLFSLFSLILTVSIFPIPFISPFISMFIHASIRGTRFNSQCSPHSVQPCRGLCALTCRRDLHVFFLFVCFLTSSYLQMQLEAVKYLKFAIFKLAISFIL